MAWSAFGGEKRSIQDYLLSTISLNVNIKTLKNTPICFEHYSDHLQGARRFLVNT